MEKPKDKQEIKAIICDATSITNLENTNDLNTWGRVRQLRKALEVSDGYPVLEDIEAQWGALSSYHGKINGEDLVKRDESVEGGHDPLGALQHHAEFGIYPPPEILLAVMQCFELYFSAGGELSLEDVFFGPEKGWVGNESARRQRDRVFYSFYFYMELEKIGVRHDDLSPKSMESMADDYLASPLYQIHIKDIEKPLPDAATFIRNYHRWKASKGKKDKK